MDIKLTAEDGYSAQRSYSIAAPADGERAELTVQRVPDGEVSPFLVDELAIGDQVELRGPIGGWIVWRPEEPRLALLVGGGSGIVPLMAMVRERVRTGSGAPFRLIYSVRGPADAYYAAELRRRVHEELGLEIATLYTRAAVEGDVRPPGRITPADVTAGGWPAGLGPRSYVCGPTGFVEAVARLLIAQGHKAAGIRTERFGPSGG